MNEPMQNALRQGIIKELLGLKIVLSYATEKNDQSSSILSFGMTAQVSVESKGRRS
jgi:hypothetical protein